MFYKTFKAVQAELSQINTLCGVQWFSNQYENTIYQSPIVFVEFPDTIDLKAICGNDMCVPCAMRLHVLSSSSSGTDGSVEDQVIIDHEALVMRIIEMLQGKQLPFTYGVTTGVTPAKYRSIQNITGWQCTLVDFTMQGFIEGKA